MLSVNKDNEEYLYRQVVDLISEHIETGTLRPGDRLPSLRRMSARIGVSIPTVRQAYVELERNRRVESRPQSGFYVRGFQENALVRPAPSFRSTARPVPVDRTNLVDRVFDAMHQAHALPLGIANPSMARSPARALHRTMKRVMVRAEERGLAYAHYLGEAGLRRQIAYRYLDTVGSQVEPDNICITNGGQEALSLALAAVARKGDVIAVESPTYHGQLELIESLGMLAIEVQTCPEEGVELEALRKTLDAHPVKSCLFSTTLGNPLGASMPTGKSKELVAMLENRDVVLIEDDVYGELRFDGQRPEPAEFHSRRGMVLTCGSFSKTTAPGYRIGWLITGRFQEEIRRLKRALTGSSGLLPQLTLAEFLASGDYDRHLKGLRQVLRSNACRMSCAIAAHFPAETRTSKPVGGDLLWLELPGAVDSETLFDMAIAEGTSIAPGRMFSPCNRYRNFIRLGFGYPWTAAIDAGVKRLGDMVSDLSARSR